MKYVDIDGRKFLEERLRLIAGQDSVLDIGSGVKFQKQLNSYQDLFKNMKYISLDINPAVKPDIVGDIHRLPIVNNSFAAVICHSVLEHARQPFLAAGEIYRVLKPGGIALIYLPFLFSYHGNRQYLDYWRFTKDGVAELFNKFSSIEICPSRRFFEMWLNLIPVFGGQLAFGGRLIDLFIVYFKRRPNQVGGWYVFLKK